MKIFKRKVVLFLFIFLMIFVVKLPNDSYATTTINSVYVSGIPDYGDLSSWAKAPMQYIMEKGIITGDMKLGYPRILPRNNATRAEAATMFMRFCEGVV